MPRLQTNLFYSACLMLEKKAWLLINGPSLIWACFTFRCLGSFTIFMIWLRIQETSFCRSIVCFLSMKPFAWWMGLRSLVRPSQRVTTDRKILERTEKMLWQFWVETFKNLSAPPTLTTCFTFALVFFWLVMSSIYFSVVTSAFYFPLSSSFAFQSRNVSLNHPVPLKLQGAVRVSS